jgi:hypothetical protein
VVARLLAEQRIDAPAAVQNRTYTGCAQPLEYFEYVGGIHQRNLRALARDREWRAQIAGRD